MKLGTLAKLRRGFLASTTATTLAVSALLVVSMTAGGSSSLRGIEGSLVHVLRAAGLVTDAHAGGGGGGGIGSTSSGTGGSFPATVTIGTSAKLIARVFAAVPVTVSCAPLPGGAVAFGGTFVQVFQAEGQTVLQGNGFASLPANACDGVAHAYTVDVYPQTNGSGVTPVFRGGPAAATANAFACDNINDCAFGSAGPQQILING